MQGRKKFHLLLPWHYLCRSLSVASASIVTILLAYNSFLYTQATGRLAKIILPSCLARWQFRNKLPVEARRRLLIIEASHPVDLSSAFSFSFLFLPLSNCSSIAVTVEKGRIAWEGHKSCAPKTP